MLPAYPDVERVVPVSERPRVEAALVRLEKQVGSEGRRIVGVRYISGRRRAFVFEIQTQGESITQSYFMKIGVRADDELVEYVRGEANNTYAVHSAMSDAGPFGVTEPIAFHEDLACFVLKGSVGERLDELIVSCSKGTRNTRQMQTTRQYCELAGRWLTEFQARVELPNIPERTTVEALLSRVERELVVLNLGAANRFSEKQCHTLRNTMISLLGAFVPNDFDTGARHNDFAPWNILCSAGEICVIDFADLTDGCKYFDAFQFVDAMHVLSNKLMVNSQVILTLKRDFIENCAVIQKASPAAEQYFRLLQKLIRVNAVLNNSNTQFPYSLKNRYLLNRYLHSIEQDLLTISQNSFSDVGVQRA